MVLSLNHRALVLFRCSKPLNLWEPRQLATRFAFLPKSSNLQYKEKKLWIFLNAILVVVISEKKTAVFMRLFFPALTKTGKRFTGTTNSPRTILMYEML